MSAKPETHIVEFKGGSLRRGFWLYVWEVTGPDGAQVFYVGRTGDSSSTNAQSPFHRMGQHLGTLSNQNMLRTHLGSRKIDPADCTFRLVARGPLLEEAETWERHRERRDVVAALEQALERAMRAVGYDVLNEVKNRKPLDAGLNRSVIAAFAEHFPKLSSSGP